MIKEANNMSDWKKADAHTKKAETTMLKALPHVERVIRLMKMIEHTIDSQRALLPQW